MGWAIIILVVELSPRNNKADTFAWKLYNFSTDMQTVPFLRLMILQFYLDF